MHHSKLRVLIIENSIDVTGALKSVTRTAQDLNAFYDFLIVIPKRSKGRKWVEDKHFLKIFELPMRELNRRFMNLVAYLPFLLANAFSINRIVRKENIGLIHVNDIYNLLPVVLRLFGNRTPYVCHVRFLPDRFPPWLFNFWLTLHLRYAAKIIAVSESVRIQLPPHEKIVMIHNELPVEERYPQILANGRVNENTFLYLSNFMVGKGQNFALEAFAKICVELPDWKLRFVGGDMGLMKNRQFIDSLKKRAQHFGFFDRTEWSEFTEDVEREYKLADVVLNFSESESFSITCLEALYYGKPLIVTDCGGPSEIVDHQITGLLIPNRNVDAMAQHMLALAKDAQMRERLGKNAREAVRTKFGFENTSLRLKIVYDSALGRTKL